MELYPVPAEMIDRAWKDGASCLSEACAVSGGEITGDQLKMILARGDRTLICMRDDEKTVGWGCVRVDQLPNLRVLHVTDLVAHNAGYEQFFNELKKMAERLGCSRVRCSCKESQARLYRMKCGFKPVFTTLEVEV